MVSSKKENYKTRIEVLLNKVFIPAGYHMTKPVELYSVPESPKYDALVFSLNGTNISYRKAKITPDRPGAFLAVWQRPNASESNTNKPIPLKAEDLDYLLVEVQKHIGIAEPSEPLKKPKTGLFLFPVSVLIEKGIVSSETQKGKTGFRVFPPWSQDRGVVGTKVFSESGKKTQRWQASYFIEVAENGAIDHAKLNKIFSH